MKFTYYGQSCFAVEANGKRLLFDPFITSNELAGHIEVNDVKADYILVSHGHSDHIEDCVAIARNNSATVIGSFEVVNWLNGQGVEKFHPMNVGGKWTFDFGTVRCTSAIHSSAMPDGSYGGNPMGFIVNADKTFYYCGDTSLTMDMQLIPGWASLDFAVLPVGDNFTMGYEDAIKASELIRCKKIVAVHYDTFGLIKVDREEMNKAFTDAGLELLMPGIGETIEL
ncbi:MAG TPA: metal-dependent hydrolase [Flavisolibacter sp.]